MFDKNPRARKCDVSIRAIVLADKIGVQAGVQTRDPHGCLHRVKAKRLLPQMSKTKHVTKVSSIHFHREFHLELLSHRWPS